MPRAKKKGKQSSEERQLAIRAAVSAVSAGQSMRSAAKEFGVANTTLQGHCGEKCLLKKVN